MPASRDHTYEPGDRLRISRGFSRTWIYLGRSSDRDFPVRVVDENDPRYRDSYRLGALMHVQDDD